MANRMKAIAISAPGGPEMLDLIDAEIPKAGPGEVLIRVEAAGVNRPDCVQRMGYYPPPPGASPLPGLEVAGEVVEVGQGVDSGLLGHSVCALLAGGGYAEYAVAPLAQCLPIPQGLSALEAAAIPETFFTVWSNLFDRADLKAGERLLVHGASGGIGTAAIQMAAQAGVEVIAMAGSEQAGLRCLELGADHVINYREQDFVSEVKALSDGQGADVILDMLGGENISRNIAAAADDGRLVFIGFMLGSVSEVNFMPLMLKRLSLTGSTLRARPVEFKAAIARQLREKLWPDLESGKVRPVIHQVLPLAKAAEAHRMMEAGGIFGNIVLQVTR